MFHHLSISSGVARYPDPERVQRYRVFSRPKNPTLLTVSRQIPLTRQNQKRFCRGEVGIEQHSGASALIEHGEGSQTAHAG